MEEVAPKPKVGVRGRWVLAGLGSALALCVIAFYAVALGFDESRYRADADVQAAEAKAAREAWDRYRRASGIPETPEGAIIADLTRQAEGESSARERAAAYRDVIDACFAAFATEDARLAASWQSNVLAPWQNLRGRFPFESTGQDADPVAVGRLFNPASGALWAVLHEYRALSEIQLQGRGVATALADQASMEAIGQRVKAALYGDHSPVIDVRLEVRVPEGAVLEAAGQVIAGGDWRALHWQEANGGAKLGDLDASSSPWGLLRLAPHFEMRPAIDLTHQ